jgi:hypothetical protein
MLIIDTTAVLLSNNQQFCYWLQGYFEISNGPVTLKQRHIELMSHYLNSISEPLGEFTAWLKQVCDYCSMQEYKAETLAYFQPIIQTSLNNVFIHAIDNSYTTTKSAEQLQNIHQGIAHD